MTDSPAATGGCRGGQRGHRRCGLVAVALDVKVILTPPCIIITLVILYTKYTGWCQNDFNVYAQVAAVPLCAEWPARPRELARLAMGGGVIQTPLSIFY
jgi:hypothetical protein